MVCDLVLAKSFIGKAVEKQEMAVKLNMLCRYLDENFNDISKLFEESFEDADFEAYDLIDFLETIARQQSEESRVAFGECCKILK